MSVQSSSNDETWDPTPSITSLSLSSSSSPPQQPPEDPSSLSFTSTSLPSLAAPSNLSTTSSMSPALPSLSSAQSISFSNAREYFQRGTDFSRVLSKSAMMPSALEVYNNIKIKQEHQKRERLAAMAEENRIEPRGQTCLRVVFYAIFYIILGLCWVGYLNWYMYFQVPISYPKLTGMQSALQMNPSLAYVPSPTVFNSLIRFRPRVPYFYSSKSDEVVAYLHAYQDNTGGTELEDCVQEGGQKQDPLRPCTYDINAGGPCNIQNGYGFETSQICFVVKMNRIYGWLPDPVAGANGPIVKCSGVTEDDTYNLGIIRYYDMDYKYSALAPGKNPGKTTNGSFHNIYFPYVNQLAYLQPLVFILFDGVRRNQFIRVRCWLIAKNIKVDCSRNEGCMNIDLIVD